MKYKIGTAREKDNCNYLTICFSYRPNSHVDQIQTDPGQKDILLTVFVSRQHALLCNTAGLLQQALYALVSLCERLNACLLISRSCAP